jgi:hypothetical protein
MNSKIPQNSVWIFQSVLKISIPRIADHRIRLQTQQLQAAGILGKTRCPTGNSVTNPIILIRRLVNGR